MKKYKKGVALVLVLATVLSVIAGSLAYFTDRVTASASATAGSLDLVLSTPSVTPATGLKPGNGSTISFTLTNKGNKSADVLETLVLTVKDSQGNAVAMDDPSEFDLYASGVTIDANGVATIADNAVLVDGRSYTKGSNQITYSIPQFTLNGTGTGAEVEPNINTNAKASAYVLVFRAGAGNDFQGVTVTLDYEAQAKQHRNTNNDTWTVVKSETIKFAGSNIAAVPTAPAA